MNRFLIPLAIMTGVMMPTTVEGASRRLINNGWQFHLTDSVTFNMQPEAIADFLWRLKLYFEGVYEKSEVYVNGHLAGGHPYGYTSFFVDITPYLKDGKNEIAVKSDNSAQKNSRWYTGSGIYRNVWLVESTDVRVADFGVGIQTPDLSTADITVTVD